MTERRIVLKDGPPWGFRINRVSGGGDTNVPVRITRVNPGSGACHAGIREADILKEINLQPLGHLTNAEVQHLLATGPTLTLTLVSAFQQKRSRDTISPSIDPNTTTTASTAVSYLPPGQTSFEGVVAVTDLPVTPPVWIPPSTKISTTLRRYKPVNCNQPSYSDGEEILKQESTFPRYQSPTVTLLQKARQGEFPKGAHYLPTPPSPNFPKSLSTSNQPRVPNTDEKESTQYYSEPESRGKSRRTFNSRESEPPRGVRFLPARIEHYDPTRPSYSSSPSQRQHPSPKTSKDLGYESDSNLVIRRRDGNEATPPPPPLSPLQQRQVYVEIQKGGDVPLQGLRKPVPARHSSGNMTLSGRGRSRSPGGTVGRNSILRSNSDVQPNRRLRPSAIPVRTLTPNPTNQKFKHSTELSSPRKVMQTSHLISLKVHIERENTASTSGKPRASTLTKSCEKPLHSGIKNRVAKVVKIEVERSPSCSRAADKSNSRHQACIPSTPKKKPILPTTVSLEVKRELPAKETRKVRANPVLTPYLRQTQRVSRSVFLLGKWPAIPRPTFTSMLRETLRTSPRFYQLHYLYTSLERLGELEKSACPFSRMKSDFDFDLWWELRRRRREESEMEVLSGILKEAQDKKEFLFRPVSSTRIRWAKEMDSGLRTKRWTIEEIKRAFASRASPPPSSASDLYKTGWRGISVRELGLNLEVASLSKSRFQFYDPTTRHGWLRRAFSMTSTLSPKERENIQKQLGTLIEKSNEVESKKQLNTIGGVVRGRMGHTLSSDPYRPSATPGNTWDGAFSESTKKAISRSLSQEIQEKGRSGILKTKRDSSLQLTKCAERCRSVSPAGMGEERSSRSNLHLLSKLAAIVLSNDPGFQKVLRREYLEEIYYSPPSNSQGRKIELLKGRFESHCSSQPDLSRPPPHPSSPDCYANWRRSRRPIYDPSSIPNVCQPTLSPHSPSSLQSLPTTTSGHWKIDPSLHRPISRYVLPPSTHLHYGTYPRGRRGGRPKYAESEVNIHYKAPIRLEEKEWIAEDELRRRQEIAMREFYKQQRERKLLQEVEDIQSRRHRDCFTPSQKSPIPHNRFEYEDKTRISSAPNVFARALFNFVPQNLRELRLRRGDLVAVRRHLDPNWLEGELGGVMGIFPASYVQLLPSGDEETDAEGEARVKFNFVAATPVEISIKQGEIVSLTRRVDQNWYEGHVGVKRRGIFPASYVEVIKEPRVTDLLRLQSQEMSWDGVEDELRIDTRDQSQLYRALYNYFPVHKDELELRENDEVEVLEMCDDGWCVGLSVRTGHFGTFPGNYIAPVG